MDADVNDETVECESGGLQADSANSDGDVNSESSDSENEPRGNRDWIMYDPKCDHKQLNFILGMRFESQQQCSSAIQRYAIVNGYDI